MLMADHLKAIVVKAIVVAYTSPRNTEIETATITLTIAVLYSDPCG
jgi:hypothetical protein